MASQSQSTGRLAGRAAIVTGGASGIGRASVELFVREGASVLAVDREDAQAEGLLRAVRGMPGRAEFLKADVAQPGQAGRTVAAALDRFGRLDVLFNNAGVHGSGETPGAAWDDCLATNLKAAYEACLAAFDPLRAAGRGSIVNTASISGPVVGFASPHYDASKAGLVGLTRHLASRWGKYGIRVNAICPGFIVTPFIGKRWTPQRLEAVKGDIALGRLGDPREIAQVALFLASDEASYVTGAAVVADGGWTTHFAKY